MSKKIVVFMGSPKKKRETFRVVQRFEERLKSYGDIDFQYVFLQDFNLGLCRGCFQCLGGKGEEYCPLQDDRDRLLEIMDNADGVIFASPNYSLQVTAVMKNFLDRLAFIFHRPRYFHKTFTAIVTQGATGGKDIVRYLEKVAGYWGFTVSSGFFVTTVTPRTDGEEAMIIEKTKRAAERFYLSLTETTSPPLSFTSFFVFRFVRSLYRAVPDENSIDYRYWKDHNWFQYDYFYETKLGLVKKALGRIIDLLGEHTGRKRQAELISQKKIK